MIAIEVPVRKEILLYKEKLFFGFSLRQFISMMITLSITLIVGLLNHFTWQFSIDDLGIGLMAISSPNLMICLWKNICRFVGVMLNSTAIILIHLSWR